MSLLHPVIEHRNATDYICELFIVFACGGADLYYYPELPTPERNPIGATVMCDHCRTWQRVVAYEDWTGEIPGPRVM